MYTALIFTDTMELLEVTHGVHKVIQIVRCNQTLSIPIAEKKKTQRQKNVFPTYIVHTFFRSCVTLENNWTVNSVL